MAIHNGEGSIDIVNSMSADGNLLLAGVGVVPSVLTIDGSMIAAPRVSLAATIDSVKIRVAFDQAMVRNSQLLDPANYLITSLGGGVSVFVGTVLAGAGTFPTNVELGLNEMTGGESYQVIVASGAGAPESQFGIKLNPLGASFSFAGEGLDPTVLFVAGVSENRVDIAFSENMLDNAAIRDSGNYVFDQGLVVTSVLDVVGNVVQLVTTDQTPGTLYNLVIG